MFLNNKVCVPILLVVYLFSGCVSAELNDPTKPIYSEVASPVVDKATFVKEEKVVLLQSIFHSEKNKIAVINGHVLAEGEYIDGILLQKINKDRVIVRYKKKEIELIVSRKLYVDKKTGESSEN